MKSSLRTLDERWKHPNIVATYGKGRHAGALATAVWLSARGLLVPPRTEWELSIVLDVADEHAPPGFADAMDTRLHVAIASTEWGFYFCHRGRASWIRITDVPCVQERDDFALLSSVPPLRELGRLVRSLEEKYRIHFRRTRAGIHSTLGGSEPAIREWVLTAL
jgi:hypothetical protein